MAAMKGRAGIARLILTAKGHILGSSAAGGFASASCAFQARGIASGFTMPTPKSLDSILKLETIESLSSEDLATMWNDYHTGRGHVSAVMTTPLYKQLKQRADACSLFVLPVRKEEGFVSLLSQAQMPHMLFTGLEDFKMLGPKASPYFTVTHYTDLADSKGLVLVRGDIVLATRLSDNEAQTLLANAHSYYLDDNRYKRVLTFNKESRDFDFRDVLQDLGIPSLS